jgi:hypothetical protein
MKSVDFVEGLSDCFHGYEISAGKRLLWGGKPFRVQSEIKKRKPFNLKKSCIVTRTSRKEIYLLEYNAVQFQEIPPTFRREFSPPS